jgi:Zn-dependent protease with chaperone function
MSQPSPLTASGTLFDGRSPLGQAARLELDGGVARLVSGDGAWELPFNELRISPRVFSTPRFVTLPNGGKLVCPDQPALDALPGASRSEGPVAWLEQRLGVAVAAVLLTLSSVAAFYFFGLPRVASAVADRISPERERAFGERTLAALDDQLMSHTELDPATVAEVRRGFAALTRDLPPARVPRLEFRHAPSIGPNAFALPGEIIVVTDQLPIRCTPEEAVVVLGHELGHVTHRHALKHLLQEIGIVTVASAVTSDASSISLSANTLPAIVLNAQYSQAFEREADEAGFALSRKAGYSPELFASCLQSLSAEHDPRGRMAGYVSTHPPDAERIARAHAAARQFERERPRAAPSASAAADSALHAPRE